MDIGVSSKNFAVRRGRSRLVTILRREAAAGVSAALLHFADACCAAGRRYLRSRRPGKSHVTSGYTAISSSRSSASSPISSSCRRRPRPDRPDLGAADRSARGQMGPGRTCEHQRRTRQRRTRPDRRTGQELAWHIAVIPPAGPGVRRSDSRGSAIRNILRPSPTLRDGWDPCWVHAISRSPAPITAGHRPCRHLRFGRNPGKLRYFPCCTPLPWLAPALQWREPR